MFWESIHFSDITVLIMLTANVIDLATNHEGFGLTISMHHNTCLIGKLNTGAVLGREVYCCGVITVKTEYSIRKFVSAKKLLNLHLVVVVNIVIALAAKHQMNLGKYR